MEQKIDKKIALSLITDQKMSKKCKKQFLSWLGSFLVF